MNKLSVQYNKKSFDTAQNDIIARALTMAISAHGEQKRANGDPFVVHPIAVAQIVADWGLDHEAIAAALLHDVVEDTSITLAQLHDEFGDAIAGLVDGVTKLRLSATPRIAPDSPRREASNENLRKLLLASTKDIRVLMLKLADRLHNMRTLEFLPEPKRKLIALESLEVFAPLADRLGMGILKGEMEDLGFKFAQPEAYDALVREVNVSAREAEHELTKLKRQMSELLKRAGVPVELIEARQKHYHSIYKKLRKVDGDISKIYDLVAVRIIVPDVASCYQTLGILHQNFKPLIYRIKDYIAVPKPNGYQSLHTTVFGIEGRITEIQIRTPWMHEAAEYGLAAHFFYDLHKNSKQYLQGKAAPDVPATLKWVQQLGDLQRSTGSDLEFVEGARLELFSDLIYVFSPRGDLYELPEGATSLDFAFAVHSKLGLRAMGARVNGRMMGLGGRLENRDVVEIIARREPAPNRDWLNFVITSQAKNRIRSWFRAKSRDDNIRVGHDLLHSSLVAWDVKRVEDLPKRAVADALDQLHLKSLDDVFVALAEGGLSASQAIRRLIPDAARPATATVIKRVDPTGRVLVTGKELSYSLAPCCQPTFPQSLVGFVTRGKGVTVHVQNCKNVPLELDRLVACDWETNRERTELVKCQVELVGINRVGLVSDITSLIAQRKLRLAGIASKLTPGSADGRSVTIDFGVEVTDMFELAWLMEQLRHIPGIETVRRVGMVPN